MVSIVLSERHRVVGAVLINLFTRDVYLSIDKGNYYKQIPSIDNNDFISRKLYSCIRGGKCIEGIDNWKKIEFRTWDDLQSSKIKNLFLCSMPEDKDKKNRRMKHTKKHIEPLFSESWKKSYLYRKKQLNFTPGPGRILFFMDIPQLNDYEKKSLDSNSYQYILSAGELLTEWIGWFAFLRHSKNLSAYCLRKKNLSIPYLKYKEDDPSSMVPSELESIFRDGFIDIGVLHTAYGRQMWKYKDTILICYDNDSHWEENSEPYLKVPIFQKKQV